MGLDLSGIELPFSVLDIVIGGLQMVELAGAFALLALSLIVAPKIVRFAKIVVEGRENGESWRQITNNYDRDFHKRKFYE
ncbi:hypothetical protein BKP35_18355 [Anaerobacillus arseniciselenatis]|uniref:Uncharacterized protein n=1 Tax=Anaerobacillus arseniciselenatis TaxID=85682 RepID=A0A1S2L7A1_9BACI|nr:hypothetical protein [Anaerobacillus arseniciselenatis]OIJ07647.1 hypothetical protein BKP35_18355 [Anaerobacillus arseniciselenatis]